MPVPFMFHKLLAVVGAVLALHCALGPSVAQAQFIGGYPAPVLAGSVDAYPDATVALDFVGARTNGVPFFKAGGVKTSNFKAIPNLTVSRSSVGYAETRGGQLLLFGPNEARITDKGLLVEESRTNSFVRSQEMDSASWSKTNVTVTADAASAPDGTTTADQAVFGSDANDRLSQTVTTATSANTTYTVSGWIRAASATTARFWVFDDVSSNQISSDFAVTTTWQRFSYTATFGAASTARSAGVRNGSAGGAKTLFIWGLQIEAGSFATSYIPTTSASATRAADNISVGGLSVGGAFAMLLESNGQTNASQIFVHARLSDGTTSNYAQFAQFSSATQVTNQAVVGGVGQVTNNGTIASGAQFKTALMYEGAGRYQSATGGTLGTAATGKTGFTGSLLGIGNTGVPGNYANTYLRRVVLYPRAFSDAELIAATQ